MAEAPLIPNRDPEPRQRPQRLRFGVFEVDPESRELRKSGIRIKLHGQPFAVLMMLLDRPGRVVSREELQQRLWAAETFVDFEHGLNKAINKLRDALGDNAENPRFVETVPRLGYRFIAPVTSAEQARPLELVPPQPGVPAPASQEPSSAEPVADATGSRRSRRILVTAACVLLVAVLAAAGLLFRDRTPVSPGAPTLKSIAVLPFADLSPQRDQGYFVDGITVALISDLAHMDGLRTISRTSVMRYRESTRPVREIAGELGVDAVVEGAVLAEGNKVRISVNLVDGRTDETLWSRQYEREMRDVLALQRDVAFNVASEIHNKAAPGELTQPARSASVDPDAYRFYLKGLQARYQDRPETWREAAEWFEKSVERDPNFAPAHVGLATAYTLLGGFTHYTSMKEGQDRARRAVRRAIELDPELAEAHLASGLMHEVYDWNWSEAERSFRRSIEISPGLGEAHYEYAWLLTRMGRFEDALREMRLALELDPRAPFVHWAMAHIYVSLGQYEAALNEYRNSLGLDPADAYTRAGQGEVYLMRGDLEKAIATLNDPGILSTNPSAPGQLAIAYARMGRHDESARIIREMEQSAGLDIRFRSWSLAVAYAGLHQPATACRWLRTAIENRAGKVIFMKADPVLRATILNEPCYQDALKSVGLSR